MAYIGSLSINHLSKSSSINMNRIQILILEHDPNDLGLLKYELKKSGLNYNLEVVDNQVGFEAALSNFKPQVILSDYSLPSFNGLKAFDLAKKEAPDTPFIIVSGTIGEEKAVELIKIGVTDYVLKDNIYQIGLKITRALQEAEDRRGKKNADRLLAESEKKYRDLFHFSPTPMWVYDPATNCFLSVNEATVKYYGYSQAEFLNLTINDILPEEEKEGFEYVHPTGEGGLKVYRRIFKHKKKDGAHLYVQVQSNEIEFEGKNARLVLATDVTERITYITAIEEQNKRLKEISWMQSHVVRAPLARIMGLVNRLKKPSVPGKLSSDVLDHIISSAEELDGIIRDIVNKTEEVTLK